MMQCLENQKIVYSYGERKYEKFLLDFIVYNLFITLKRNKNDYFSYLNKNE